MDDDLFTMNEIADKYGVSRRTVERWAENGAVEKVKIGGTVRIRVDPPAGDRREDRGGHGSRER